PSPVRPRACGPPRRGSRPPRRSRTGPAGPASRARTSWSWAHSPSPDSRSGLRAAAGSRPTRSGARGPARGVETAAPHRSRGLPPPRRHAAGAVQAIVTATSTVPSSPSPSGRTLWRTESTRASHPCSCSASKSATTAGCGAPSAAGRPPGRHRAASSVRAGGTPTSTSAPPQSAGSGTAVGQQARTSTAGGTPCARSAVADGQHPADVGLRRGVAPDHLDGAVQARRRPRRGRVASVLALPGGQHGPPVPAERLGRVPAQRLGHLGQRHPGVPQQPHHGPRTDLSGRVEAVAGRRIGPRRFGQADLVVVVQGLDRQPGQGSRTLRCSACPQLPASGHRRVNRAGAGSAADGGGPASAPPTVRGRLVFRFVTCREGAERGPHPLAADPGPPRARHRPVDDPAAERPPARDSPGCGVPHPPRPSPGAGVSTRVLVTGGSSGLGRALVEHYAAAGCRVLVADLAEPAALPAGELVYQRLDVRSEAGWATVREWCRVRRDGLDLLVNNAGVAAAGRMERLTDADWDWVLDVNLRGAVLGCRTFVPVFKAQRRGHIVNVASLAGLVNPPGLSAYNVSEAAVISLS